MTKYWAIGHLDLQGNSGQSPEYRWRLAAAVDNAPAHPGFPSEAASVVIYKGCIGFVGFEHAISSAFRVLKV